MKPLKGLKVISTATHLPGPLAVARLKELGADVLKIEPPHGDFLAHAYPQWYQRLHKGILVVKLDLKRGEDWQKVRKEFKKANVLLTAQKIQSLGALGLEWRKLHKNFPKLHHVGLVGAKEISDPVPGHDLNYQAKADLIFPGQLPRALVGDYFASQRLVQEILLIKMGGRSKKASQVWVSIEEAAHVLAEPYRVGATRTTGPLGGAVPAYGVYECRDGWVALCALEIGFQNKIKVLFDLHEINKENLAKKFKEKPRIEWETWAAKNEIPLTTFGV